MRLDVRVACLAIVCAACGGGGGGGGGVGGPVGGSGEIDGGAGDAGVGIDAAANGDSGVGCGLRTCESAGATCGPIGDGCGGVIECGDCDAPETCGGGGTPSVCGGSSACVPATCDSTGANCGPIGDGCGNSVETCGECDPGEVCGGDGTPSVCSTDQCTNLCEQQVDCEGGATTSVSGIVRTPAGDLPLYNISVYVPNAPLDAIPTGNDACLSCDAPLSGEPLVVTTTDSQGRFVLEDMPVGTNIPLVIQSGKWRRLVTIPTVTECTDTPVAAGLTRFPRRQGEGGVPENNIPRIALTTGGADALECLLRKIGIADAEFTPQAGSGRVNLYAGFNGTDRYINSMNGGAAFSTAATLWNQVGTLDNYDMVVLSCEGAGDNPGNRGPNALTAMNSYLEDHGGRVFGSHWHHSWVELGPTPMSTVGTFTHRSDLPKPHTVTVNTDPAFPKGVALAEWLVNVGASMGLGQLVLLDGQHTVDSVDSDLADTWIFGTNPNDSNEPGVQYMSFNTPVDSADDEKCGRMVVTDIHVAAGDDSDDSLSFPDGCTSGGLLPEEKALIFLLFDLASCVTTDVPTCTERTCEDVGAGCGDVADGCGGLLDCGDCTPPDTCGGGGTPNQCGNDGCVPVTCEDAGAECGPIADGCGETVDCGTCTPPETCGGAGTPNVCGGIIVD